jgi:hypothetical protein
MDMEQLMGRNVRLRQELAVALATQPLPRGRINRLVNDIADTEREISTYQATYRTTLSALWHVA